jgi:hypothetical protein
LEQSLWIEDDTGDDDDDTSRPVSSTLRLVGFCQYHLQRISYHVCRTVRRQFLEPFGPELRCLTVYWLERMSLVSSSSSATIAEALYGGKRVKLEGTETSSSSSNNNNNNNNKSNHYLRRRLRPLSKQDGIRLALFMAIGPYLEERSNVIQKLLMIRISKISYFSTRIKHRLHIFLQIVWPLLRLTTKVTHWLYQWRYLLGKSVFFDPYSSYLNLVLRRVTMEDHHHQQQEQRHKYPSTEDVDNQMKSSQQQKQQQLITCTSVEESDQRHSVQDLIPLSLRHFLNNNNKPTWGQTTGIGSVLSLTFVLAFLARVQSIQQSMQQEDEEERYDQLQQQGQQESRQLFPGTSQRKSIPPPPAPATSSCDVSISGIKRTQFMNLTPKVCPLCQEPRVNPTACVSGYVFCYKCIVDFVKKEGICPVTGRECNITNLIRLYEPTT